MGPSGPVRRPQAALEQLQGGDEPGSDEAADGPDGEDEREQSHAWTEQRSGEQPGPTGMLHSSIVPRSNSSPRQPRDRVAADYRLTVSSMAMCGPISGSSQLSPRVTRPARW